jgi:predicted Rossmann fold nucleotide-binding protein DprA/Smf involved in DNA uptake
MIVGFTGTRDGCTQAQKAQLCRVLRRLSGDSIREPGAALMLLLHGACVGADEAAAVIACGLAYHVRAMPCTFRNMQSRVSLEHSDEVFDEQAPMVRNRAIVAECSVLVACPRGMHERQRSGTWATVRYARKAGKPIVIVWPDGSVTEEPAVGPPS